MVGTRWDAQSCSPADAIRLNGIMPITFQTGWPHSHLGERVMGRRGGGGQEGVMESRKDEGRGVERIKRDECGLLETASSVV